MAQTPETSDYTSTQERTLKKQTKLKSFGTSQRNSNEYEIPFALGDYLSLVETTGRAIINGNKGYIPQELPDILQILGLNNNTWLNQIKYFDKWYYKAIMIYVPVNPTACRLRRSNLIQSNLVEQWII